MNERLRYLEQRKMEVERLIDEVSGVSGKGQQLINYLQRKDEIDKEIEEIKS